MTALFIVAAIVVGVVVGVVGSYAYFVKKFREGYRG